MLKALISDYWTRSSRYRALIFLSVLGAVALSVPLQHYISLGRYQHYAIGIALIGAGHLVQVLLSWKNYPRWGRISLLLTGVFLLLVAYVFWSNPWLDVKVAVQTEGKEELRSKLLSAYMCSAIVIFLSYIKWRAEEHRIKQEKPDGTGGES
jgi:hypothetical protein